MRLFFILFLLVFFAAKAFTQPGAYPQLKLSSAKGQSSLQTRVSTSPSFLKKDSGATILPVQTHLPLNFYSQHLGTACKLELQLEKQTKLPIRIRLGSKEQVDYLEGKFSKNR